ncbi:MAG TPA: type VI secretion system ATPase TssH, partial [Acidimicrobiaceae bacterium]|nr:type VI secretion system ATPase TssH [Acidimicrobiaceae bacterium]
MPLDPNKWTLKTQEAFSAAVEQAKSLNNPEVTADHLLAALLRQTDGGIALPILEKVGVDHRSVRNAADEAIAKLPKAYGGSEPRLSRELSTVMTTAEAAKSELGDEYLSVEHLLLGLTEKLGVTKDDLLSGMREVRGSHRVTSQNPEDQYQALEKYGRDLTAAARAGKLDPVIGRDEEIRRVIQVLSRRTKNNPVLIG